MGDTIGALFIRIGTDLTDLHAGIGKGGKADQELGAFTGRVNSALGSMGAIGAKIGAAAIVATAVGLGFAAKSAADFQAQMRLLVTQAGASTGEMNAMSKGVLDMAGSMGTAPAELAKGLYHIESAGFRGATALNALRIAAEGAKVGNANLEDVTNALDAVLVAGVPEASNMAGAMGELNAIVGAGDMRMQDLADAMGTGILASAKEFGLGLKDVGAALAVMGDNNIRGSDAATKLRMSISLMGATTPKAAKELSTIGISSLELANKMRSGGLIAALQDLQDKLKKSGKTASEQAEILSRAFGGGKSAGTILLLLQQLDRLKTKEGDITKGAGGFQAAWANTQKNFTFQWQAADSALGAAAIKIGTKLLPPLTELLQNVIVPLVPKVADMASGFVDKAVPAVKKFVDYIIKLKPDFVTAFNIISSLKPYLVEIGAAWVVWNVALAITKAIGMAQFLIELISQSYIEASAVKGMSVMQWLWNAAMEANPIGVVVLAIAALVAGVIFAYTHFSKFRDFVNGAWDTLKNFGSWIVNHAGPIFSALGALLSDVASGNIMALPGDVGKLKSVMSFDTGGMVPGSVGSPHLAIVHGGERVLTPQQQRQGAGGATSVVVELTPARLNNPADLLDALYALMSAAQTRRTRGAQGLLGSVD